MTQQPASPASSVVPGSAVAAPYVAVKPPYLVTTDLARFDVDAIWGWLRGSYWAAGIPREVVERSLRGSIAFGLFEGARQIGVARVVTDQATFAYLADVFVDESCRGRGLATWLIEVIRMHPSLQGLRRWLLATRDAHGLYEKCGFRPVAEPGIFMEIVRRDIYR
jgi:GNAT superfamily N-acetyltransferase